MHKDSKLGIMTNVGKNRLVKVIFTNVHKISDACANRFGRYIMIAQCMRNIFTFYYINSSFSAITPTTPSITAIVQPPPF